MFNKIDDWRRFLYVAKFESMFERSLEKEEKEERSGGEERKREEREKRKEELRESFVCCPSQC